MWLNITKMKKIMSSINRGKCDSLCDIYKWLWSKNCVSLVIETYIRESTNSCDFISCERTQNYVKEFLLKTDFSENDFISKEFFVVPAHFFFSRFQMRQSSIHRNRNLNGMQWSCASKYKVCTLLQSLNQISYTHTISIV